MVRLSVIPYPCDTFEEAKKLQDRMVFDGIFVATRSDYSCIEQGAPDDHNKWYLVIYTGNVRGMLLDLQDAGYL